MTDAWTLTEAAQFLDPPMTAEQLRHLVKAAAIPSVGKRSTGRPGRPAALYDSAAILQAHAGIAPFLAAAETPQAT